MKLPNTISFVDLETTGTSAQYNRIIEVGILKVDNGKVVKEYKQLINPQTYIDPFITSMTGINAEMIANAPTFDEVKKEILEILVDSVFVAHNVRFDYGFLRNEFKRSGINFSSQHCCTVKLSRTLFPEWERHNLDTVIKRFAIPVKERHRAFDDAQALYTFWQKAQEMIQPEIFQKAVNVALKTPTRPLHLLMKN